MPRPGRLFGVVIPNSGCWSRNDTSVLLNPVSSFGRNSRNWRVRSVNRRSSMRRAVGRNSAGLLCRREYRHVPGGEPRPLDSPRRAIPRRRGSQSRHRRPPRCISSVRPAPRSSPILLRRLVEAEDDVLIRRACHRAPRGRTLGESTPTRSLCRRNQSASLLDEIAMHHCDSARSTFERRIPSLSFQPGEIETVAGNYSERDLPATCTAPRMPNAL